MFRHFFHSQALPASRAHRKRNPLLFVRPVEKPDLLHQDFLFLHVFPDPLFFLIRQGTYRTDIRRDLLDRACHFLQLFRHGDPIFDQTVSIQQFLSGLKKDPLQFLRKPKRLRTLPQPFTLCPQKTVGVALLDDLQHLKHLLAGTRIQIRPALLLPVTFCTHPLLHLHKHILYFCLAQLLLPAGHLIKCMGKFLQRSRIPVNFFFLWIDIVYRTTFFSPRENKFCHVP